MITNSYRAYGLSFVADLVCPELPPDPHPGRDADVTIQSFTKALRPLCGNEDYRFEVLPGIFRLDVSGVARYCVREARTIVVEPLNQSLPAKVRLFLLGSTMGALLYQRGLLPLHGCAIETPFGTMIFVGAQGSGKSTLAAEFQRRGYRILSDDICAVQQIPAGFQVLPALAHLRLCEDAYDRVGRPEGARFDVDKFIVPLGERYCPHPARLTAVHVLSDHKSSEPRFEFLCGLDRVRLLFENLYRPQFLKGQQTQAQLTRMVGSIAQQAAVVSVNRRRDAARTSDLIRFLEDNWSQNFAPAAPMENM